MRRVAGAWLLFCLVALPDVANMTARLVGERLAGVPAHPAGLADTGETVESFTKGNGKYIPNANVLPPKKTAPVSQELPPRFVSEPLCFFSTAPPESLALLPGVGPVLAARISDARGGKRLFTTWDDLQQVKGIGKKMVSKFKRLADAK
jgi:predicted flap endonuclease-1-like 5' DNA nuclease